jgi:predicted transcriptional regulator
MPCVWPDGSLSTSGRLLLASVSPNCSAEEVSAVTGIPLYRVRSSLRQLLAAGYISQEGEHFRQTDEGARKVKEDG